MLKARKLIVELGGNTIISSVDFQAQEGELIGILGPSGSGKSTLLMALNGFRPAKTGSVLIDGQDLYENFHQLKGDIGYVPQDDIVPSALKVERILQYAAELRLPDEPPDVRIGRVKGVIHSLGLSDRKDLRVSSLSGGQRKRVSVGVELLSRPRYLFADEPTSGLDPALERSLTETFKKMTDDGSTIIVTTHIMSSLSIYDRLAVIVGGRLAFFGPPDELKPYFDVSDYADIYTKLTANEPTEWHRRYQKSPIRSRYLN